MNLPNSINNLLKNLWFAFKIIGILSVFSLAIVLFLKSELTWANAKGQIFYNFYYGISLSLVNGYFFDNLNRLFPWEKNAKTRAWFGFLGSIVITMITLFILNLILWVIIWENDWSVLFSERNRMFYLIGLIITIIISSILHAIGFFKKVQEQKMDNQKLKEEKLHMELNALKSQLDPHFLFNSFNVLSGLIDEDKDKAQGFLSGMSKIYRYVLEKRNEDTNSIKEEIEFAKTYLALHQTRFEDSIFLKIELEPFIEQMKIPSLSLQLLLENAIKHNAFNTANPLNIKITNDQQHLIISNNIQERKQLAESNGIGLQNISDRYSLLTDKTLIKNSKNGFFTVKLPCLI